MRYLDLTFPTPQENLACDEALIDLCEESHHHEVLRFWEPREPFVVLGYSSKMDLEVNLSSCEANRIPVLRRVSGGGTVLQGPGCLNYSLILTVQESGPLTGIASTYAFVMEGHRRALGQIIGSEVRIQGLSDLALGGCKFSGNAQYRRRRFVLLHGTFLLQLDLGLMGRLLPLPRRQPLYRQNRAHRDFLINLGISSVAIKEALRRCWNVTEMCADVPHERIAALVSHRYARAEWNCKF